MSAESSRTNDHCERCGRGYVCTPWDDFYCADAGDHCCEACLVGGLPVHVIPAGEIQPPREKRR